MKRKFISVLLTLAMVLSMSLPSFADEVNLDVDNSADGIYAALQADMAAGSPVITTGIKGKITIENLNDGAVLTGYKLLNITANADGTIASVDLNHAYDADVWGPLGITSVQDLSTLYRANTSYLSTFMNQLNTASPTMTGGINSPAAAVGSTTFPNLDLGMYYIVQNNVGVGSYYATVPMLITIPYKSAGAWYSDVTATAKNNVGLDKKVKAAEDSVFQDTTDQYSLQKLDYRVEADAPQWSAASGQVIDVDNVKFAIYDSFDAQEYLDGSLTVCALPSGVTVSDTDTFASLSAKPGVVDATSWFTVSKAASSFTAYITGATFPNMMTVNGDGSQSATYSKYVFFYSVTLDYACVLGKQGNKNHVVYQFSRDLDNVNDWGRMDDSTKAFTYALEISKYYEESGTEYRLGDAEFQILKGTDKLWFLHMGSGQFHYNTTDTTGFTFYADKTYSSIVPGPTDYAKDTEGRPVTTILITKGPTGAAKEMNLNVRGLDEGTYTIKETKAPSGYSKISDIDITLTGIVDGNGNKTGELQDITIGGDTVSGATGILIFSILDGTGMTLPSTGGAGIIIFTLTGMAILLGCEAAYLVRKSRKKYTQK